MVSCTVDPNEVLKRSKTVAVVGASKNPEKEANTVPLYLIQHGYTVVPVNPTADIIHGLKVYPSLAELPPDLAARVEVVEVFRPSEELPEIARQVVELERRTKKTPVFWAQLGLENEEAKRILKKGGVPYVMDLCMRTLHQLHGGGAMTSQHKLNAEWHKEHPMPKNPTMAERIEWHLAHSEICGCRPVPPSLAADVTALRTRRTRNRVD